MWTFLDMLLLSVFFIICPLLISLYNIAVLIVIRRFFLINVVVKICKLLSKLDLPTLRKGSCLQGQLFNSNVGLKKKHMIIRTAMLYNEINSGQIVTLKKVYDRNVVNKYGLYLLLGVIIYNLIDYIYIYI